MEFQGTKGKWEVKDNYVFSEDNKSIEELVEMAQRPFTKAQDLHELSQQQCDLFEFETDCFCKAS